MLQKRDLIDWPTEETKVVKIIKFRVKENTLDFQSQSYPFCSFSLKTVPFDLSRFRRSRPKAYKKYYLKNKNKNPKPNRNKYKLKWNKIKIK